VGDPGQPRRAEVGRAAEGVKQSQILTAEGEKQSAVLRAEGARTAAILKAEGEAKAIETVFGAIHDGAPDQALLSYQYLQMLPQLAQGDSNKIFVIPSEFSQALSGLAERFGAGGANGVAPPPKPKPLTAERAAASEQAAADAAEAAQAAKEASEAASAAATPGVHRGGAELPPPSETPPGSA
jgi:hypothetical protein